MLKIGFIGSGNMATAMINGLLHTELFIENDIYIYDEDTLKTNELKSKYDINISSNNIELVKEVDVIVFAVKPYIVKHVVEEIKEYVDDSKLIISIAAGITIKTIETYFNKQVKVVRTMPNTAVLVNEGMTAITFNNNITVSDQLISINIFDSFGKSIVLEETHFDMFTSICASSPAFVYMFIEALSLCGVEDGLNKEDVYKMVAQSVLGSAKMVLKTEIEPLVLKDRVCTKGGTTIEGVKVLEKHHFIDVIKEAAIKTKDRSKEMSK